jgi:hypothetical protein
VHRQRCGIRRIPGPALAALVSTGGGDFDVVPLFRALAFGTVNFGGNGGAIDGIDYASISITNANVNDLYYEVTGGARPPAFSSSPRAREAAYATRISAT